MVSLMLMLALASAPPADAPAVGLFRLSGALGEELRTSTVRALETDFPVRAIALDESDVLETLGCEALDALCLARLWTWLGQNPNTSIRYAVFELHGSPARRIAVYDLHEGTTVETLAFRDDTGDMVLPLVVPLAIARAIREHHWPPHPITDAERLELALIDEPPYEGLSAYPPPHDRHTRCTVRSDAPPSLFWVLLLLLVARQRRSAVVERLADSGRLPADVAARLRSGASD